MSILINYQCQDSYAHEMIIYIPPIMLIIEPRMVRNGPGFGFTSGFSVGMIQCFTFVKFWVERV
jgi:hypothetical protein